MRTRPKYHAKYQCHVVSWSWRHLGPISTMSRHRSDGNVVAWRLGESNITGFMANLKMLSERNQVPGADLTMRYTTKCCLPGTADVWNLDVCLRNTRWLITWWREDCSNNVSLRCHYYLCTVGVPYNSLGAYRLTTDAWSHATWGHCITFILR